MSVSQIVAATFLYVLGGMVTGLWIGGILDWNNRQSVRRAFFWPLWSVVWALWLAAWVALGVAVALMAPLLAWSWLMDDGLGDEARRGRKWLRPWRRD